MWQSCRDTTELVAAADCTKRLIALETLVAYRELLFLFRKILRALVRV